MMVSSVKYRGKQNHQSYSSGPHRGVNPRAFETKAPVCGGGIIFPPLPETLE
jgi:hypothetical protein